MISSIRISMARRSGVRVASAFVALACLSLAWGHQSSKHDSYGKTDAVAVKTEKANLAKLQKAYDLSKAQMLKSKNQGAKVSFSKAASTYGTAVMNAMSYTDRALKYKTALHLFREALTADATNAEAKQNKDLIEGIYKSMGKKIPN